MTNGNLPDASADPRRTFAVDVVTTLRGAGFDALWAGGCVRDALLGKVPKDYDVATTATPDEVIRLFGTRRTVAVGASFGVVMVLGPSKKCGQIEVATFRMDGQYLDGRRPTSVTFCRPEEDAKRRDFTINGLFFDPIEGVVIDYVGGQEDLKRQVVRAIGDPHARFAEDKLRMLRAIRFAATFSFSLDSDTADAIRAHHRQLDQVSVERIAQELRRMLAHPSRSLSLQMMQDTKLLGEVLPEICDEKGSLVDQHSLAILNELEVPSSESSMAVLFRNLLDTTINEPRLRRQQVEDLCRRLKMSNEEITLIIWLLESLPVIDRIVDRPLHVRKTLLAHPQVDLLFDISRATAIADGREPIDSNFCRNYLAAVSRDFIAPAQFVNGKDVMMLGIPAGPAIRQILERLWHEQLDEKLSSREQALERLKDLVQGDPAGELS